MKKIAAMGVYNCTSETIMCVKTVQKVKIKYSCPMEFSHYPFDTQVHVFGIYLYLFEAFMFELLNEYRL